MIEFLRAFRLGVVNLFGVAIPGFLLIFLFVLGFVMPTMAIVLHMSGISLNAINPFSYNPTFIAAIMIIFSYVAGYILRLMTPDKLDKVSAKKVIEGLPEKEKDIWPIRIEDYEQNTDNKYPYFYMREYLEARDFKYLLELVKWGPDNSINNGQENRTKRSKTAVNKMKLDISLYCDDLAANVESNEAHVRLMSGTWLAIKANLALIFVGASIAGLGIIIVYSDYIRGALNLTSNDFGKENAPAYPVFLSITIILLIIMHWAKNQIEELFHYRRVSELVYIIMAAEVAGKEHQKMINTCKNNAIFE